MKYPNTEKDQASCMGQAARVDELGPSEDYIPETQQERQRRVGQTGLIIDYSNRHGLCYKLLFADGGTAWFEPPELKLLVESAFEYVRSTSMTEDQAKEWAQWAHTTYKDEHFCHSLRNPYVLVPLGTTGAVTEYLVCHIEYGILARDLE